MKFKNIKVAFTLITGVSVVLAGCLKDKDYDNGLIQSVANGKTKVISLAANVQTQENFTTLAYDNSNNDTVVDYLPVELSNGNSPAPEDIHVTIAQVDSLVNHYDTVHYYLDDGSTYDYTVPTAFSIVNPVVTIPKGKYQGFLQIKFKPSDLIGQDLAIGFAIQSIQEKGYTISGNLNTAVIAIVIKNIWDGTYLANGYFSHPTLGGPFSNKTVVLSTSTATSVDMLGGQPAASATIGAYPRLTVDPSTNKVTLIGLSVNGGPAFNGPSDPTYDNHYDPASKTFFINYGYTTSAPREAWDTLVYQGPR